MLPLKEDGRAENGIRKTGKGRGSSILPKIVWQIMDKL